MSNYIKMFGPTSPIPSPKEIIVSLGLVILLVLFLNPRGILMPNMYVMILLLGILIVYALYVSLIWREKAEDEREMFHKLIAGRIAFITATGILTLAIVLQSFSHSVDPWLVITLVFMLIAKALGLIYCKLKR